MCFVSYEGYAAFVGVNLDELHGEAPTIRRRKSWRIKIMKNLMRLFSTVALAAVTLVTIVGCDENPELTKKVNAATDAFEATVDSIVNASDTLESIKKEVVYLDSLEEQYATDAKATVDNLAKTREAFCELENHKNQMDVDVAEAKASKEAAVAATNETTTTVQESVEGLGGVVADATKLPTEEVKEATAAQINLPHTQKIGPQAD